MAPATNSPRMRTARLISSLHSVLSVSRSHGVAASIAYVTVTGQTRFLWREHDAVVGSLLQAEAMAWTTIARSLSNTSLVSLLRERVESLTQHGFCDGLNLPSLEPVEGGVLLALGADVVGAVGIAGDFSVAIRTQLGRAAITGYFEQDLEASAADTCHFSETQRGTL
jgi:uncharacterized protein GlcG (DUF336 family)